MTQPARVALRIAALAAAAVVLFAPLAPAQTLYGSIVGTVVGACVGALGGAILGELWKGREVDHALKVGNAAMWGRLVGSLVKICIASMMAAVAMCSAVLH